MSGNKTRCLQYNFLISMKMRLLSRFTRFMQCILPRNDFLQLDLCILARFKKQKQQKTHPPTQKTTTTTTTKQTNLKQKTHRSARTHTS
jgi:hypothetical protein